MDGGTFPVAEPLRSAASRLPFRPPSNSGRRRAPTTKPSLPSLSAPPPPEVISSLINSLSAISAPVQDHFENLPTIEDSLAEQEARLPLKPSQRSLRSSARSSSRNLAHQNGWGMDYGAYKRREDIVDEYISDEDDAAPPPSVRMAKAPTPKSKSKSPGRHFTTIGQRRSLSTIGGRRSQQSLRSRKDSATMIGMPSIERSTQNSSMTSLTSSVDIASAPDFTQRRSRDALTERVNGATPQDDRSSAGSGLLIGAGKYLKHSRSKQSLNKGTKGDTAVETASRPTSLRRVGRSDSSGLTALSPGRRISHDSARSSHGALSNHLIPSRRSSVRHSRQSSLGGDDKQRYSTNLDDLAIDQELIENDHSTVRRIRELHEAKEKREKAWKESTKSSEKSRRQGMAAFKTPRRTNSKQSTHLSIAEETHPIPAGAPAATGVQRRPGTATSENFATPPRLSSQMHEKRSSLSGVVSRTGSPLSPRKKRQSLIPDALTSNSQDLYTHPLGSVDAEVDTFLQSPRLTQKIKHPRNGRIIAFSEVGDPDGFVVICCVGMGLTRYLTAFYDELARTLKLRLITPDRPGIGESQAASDNAGMPLNWPDDVELICEHLGITKFSLLAHSAGALYALATALRTPQKVRGRVHLLAPWITPSQISSGGYAKEAAPAANIPFSQKILSILPASFLKAANANFFGAASASIHKSPKNGQMRRSMMVGAGQRPRSPFTDSGPETNGQNTENRNTPTSPRKPDAVSCYQATNHALVTQGIIPLSPTLEQNSSGLASGRTKTASPAPAPVQLTPSQHRIAYDEALTPRIWHLATTNANPAVDLIICLEKIAPIGFQYTDITRTVVIHHGTRDTRVPVENVRWLVGRMTRCELRELEGEGHGLMASAGVMAEILGEVAGEWENWARVARGKTARRRGGRGPWEDDQGDGGDELVG